MKFWFKAKVKEVILAIIRRSSVENHSAAYLNSISLTGNRLPQHVDFHVLLCDSYRECLDDYDAYLYKEKKFDKLQAAIFVITKVFQHQSKNPNAHQEMRSAGKLGELISEASIEMYSMAEAFLEEEPEMFKPAFNYPNSSTFEDIDKARSRVKEDERTAF